MKFIISSTELLGHLTAVSKVISSKHTLPILDNFLFDLKDSELVITGTDLETTMISRIELENATGEGRLAVEARRLTNILKEFPEQPLTFDINMETLQVDILSANGKFSIVGQDADEFPQLTSVDEEQEVELKMSSNLLSVGINKTIFATGDDEIRPVINGISVKIEPGVITFAASDSHKLVRYKRMDIETSIESEFILPKKPATLLKNILPTDDTEISLKTDMRTAIFSINGYELICKLIDGKYPNYNSIIPVESSQKVIVNRLELFNTIRRVAVFSNQTSNLIELQIKPNSLMVSAQDIDFSISAYENISCQYDGEEISIGFQSIFLNEILNNINSNDVVIELEGAQRAGLILPLERDNENEDELMLLMPITL